MKKTVLLFFICSSLCSMAAAQQLTRFAVVDLPKVYISFFSESRAVREFEERSARIQSEINRMTAEIQTLRVNLTNARAQNNQELINRLETDINRRTDYLTEYYRTQTDDLERQKSQLMQSGSFLEQVYDEIRYIAESEGYTMVLSLNDNTGIVWYSSTVDITDKLITNLISKSR